MLLSICVTLLLTANIAQEAQTWQLPYREEVNCQLRRNAHLCKPCHCDLNGSISADCSKLTRRCLCKPGYQGAKCKECSLGYYQESSSAITNGTNRTECFECGSCFTGWQRVISPLKELAIESIKRAHALEQAITSEIGLALGDGKESRLTVQGNRTRLRDLRRGIESISQRIIDNKRKSDLIKLLADEYGIVQKSLAKSQAEFKNMLEMVGNLTNRVNKLQTNLKTFDLTAAKVSEHTSKFKEHVEILQEFSLLGAYQLIKRHHASSQVASLEAIRNYNILSTHTSGFLQNFEPRMDKIRYRARQMDYIGEMMLNEVLSRRKQEGNSLEFNEGAFRDTLELLLNSSIALNDLSARKLERHQQISNDTSNYTAGSIQEELETSLCELVGTSLQA